MLLAMVMQPWLAFGQSMAETTEPHSPAHQMAAMDCCANGLEAAERGEQAMPCGDMAPADCTLAAGLGSCSAMLSVLLTEKTDFPAQSGPGPVHRHPQGGYLSIILDTLTPPPNSLQA